MQEDIENRSVTLVVSGTKLTGRLIKPAIAKYLAHRKEVKLEKHRTGDVVPRGKQSVKELGHRRSAAHSFKKQFIPLHIAR